MYEYSTPFWSEKPNIIIDFKISLYNTMENRNFFWKRKSYNIKSWGLPSNIKSSQFTNLPYWIKIILYIISINLSYRNSTYSKLIFCYSMFFSPVISTLNFNLFYESFYTAWHLSQKSVFYACVLCMLQVYYK